LQNFIKIIIEIIPEKEIIRRILRDKKLTDIGFSIHDESQKQMFVYEDGKLYERFIYGCNSA